MASTIYRWRVTLAGACLILLVAAVGGAMAFRSETNDRLVVHEWGTFTSLQDETGTDLAGINVDDEPVPGFVHGVGPRVLEAARFVPFSKCIPRRHPQVLVRLETPVMYFYPPASAQRPMRIDVEVRSRGGWLTEYYPNAEAITPGLKKMAIAPGTEGVLRWDNLQIGTDGVGPETEAAVWLAPREVAAAAVTNEAGESEKYLFYRGVGNYRAPLRVETERETGKVTIRGRLGGILTEGASVSVGPFWLVKIHQDGTLAYRTIDSVRGTADAKRVLATTSSRFEEEDFSTQNFEHLRRNMHRALVDDGLFADEAHAMLNTWEHAYFKTAGLRLFFMVPRAWTDDRLPLSLSEPAEIERVMVGRIELVSPEQRELLARLARAKVSDTEWMWNLLSSDARERFLAGRSDFGELGVTISADYQAYLDLGRFRNALIRAEQARRPSASLKKFIGRYGLGAYGGAVGERKVTTEKE